jgi:amino acid permease
MSDFKKTIPPSDVEKPPSTTSVTHTEAGRGYEIGAAAVDHKLKRQLKDRHIAMISIGGTSTHFALLYLSI